MFGPESLLRVLQQLPTPSRYVLALSGGLDSMVLLHALSALRERLSAPVTAIHVDHQLQPDSAGWSRHCAQVCAGLEIPCEVVQIELVRQPRTSLEAAARESRYQVMGDRLPADGMLLTAHQQDDQAETLLLQLLRGAGLDGLAAMPRLRRWRQGWLVRPLLDWPRESLAGYAKAHGLSWIEDPSNADPAFDRNYLRTLVMPLLRQRWQAVGANLARSARHCADAAHLLQEMGEEDLRACGAGLYRLDIAALQRLGRERRFHLLRCWIRRAGLPLPDAAMLERVVVELVPARADAAPLLHWPGTELRRYREALQLMPELPEAPLGWQQQWDGSGELELPAGLGRLRLQPADCGIARRHFASGAVRVGFRSEGLGCTPAGRSGSRSFKRLAQDYAIPPWLRERVPLLLLGDRLVAVGDILHCAGFSAGAAEAAVVVQWQRPDWLG